MPKHIQMERARLMKQSMKEYAHIKKNVYIDRKKYAFIDDDAYVCSCDRPSSKQLIDDNDSVEKYEDEAFGCGKSCINKMVSWECVEHLCPCGIACRNRRFQLHEYSEVYPVKTDDRGWGLCAGEFLPKGTFVMQYIGEIYSIDSEYGLKKLHEYRNKTCTYLMSISKNEVIDPTFKGNLARFINHSCEPNCETQKWHVLGEICVGIFTLRDINEGEELTFNYGFNILKTIFQKCLCGTDTCKGYLGLVQNDVAKDSSRILCELCKTCPRGSETILVCDKCKRIYHKNCAKKYNKGVLTDKSFICGICVKKDKSLFTEKKSSQQLIKEFKKKREVLITNKQTEESISVTESIENNIVASFSEAVNINDDLITNNNIPAIKEDENESNIFSKKTSMIPQFRIEEDLIIDETMEVEESQLFKIRKNLKNLSNIGARLFWDFRQINTSAPVELKITGTISQIEKVKEQIKKIVENKDYFVEQIHSMAINVPKIFVRKIIGHQNRNLISYKSKYNVEIDYDPSLITDDIFQIYETTSIILKGKEHNVKIVENEINKFLFNLKVCTIYLMTTDYILVKNSICQLKTLIDPADLRLRKKESKIEKEIKHSFYYISNSTRELVIIGFENELKKGEKLIKEFLLRQNTLEHNYSLCFLCPTYTMTMINNFKTEYQTTLRVKNIHIRVVDPNYIRKHLNLYLEGKWKDIMEIKSLLFQYFENNNKSSGGRRKNNIMEFQQYAYNQEHKLISKNLRKYFVEGQLIKNWDLISDEVSNAEVLLSKEEDHQILRNFLSNPDRDTLLNYSLHLPPSSYNTTFNMSKLDLSKSLINYVEEAYDSYNLMKKEGIENERKLNTEILARKELDTPKKECEMTPGGAFSDIRSVKSKREDSVPAMREFDSPSNYEDRLSKKDREPSMFKEPSIVMDDPNKKEISNIISNNFSTTIDNIQNTLLYKLNELRNEGNDVPMNDTSNKESDSKDSKKSYEIVMNKEDLNMFINNNNPMSNFSNNINNNPPTPIINNTLSNSEAMNISYNFSNISQMNININIQNYKDLIDGKKPEFNQLDEVKEAPVKYSNFDNDYKSNYLRRKQRPVQSLGSPPRRKHYYTNAFENKDKDKERDNDKEVDDIKSEGNMGMNRYRRNNNNNYSNNNKYINKDEKRRFHYRLGGYNRPQTSFRPRPPGPRQRSKSRDLSLISNNSDISNQDLNTTNKYNKPSSYSRPRQERKPLSSLSRSESLMSLKDSSNNNNNNNNIPKRRSRRYSISRSKSRSSSAENINKNNIQSSPNDQVPNYTRSYNPNISNFTYKNNRYFDNKKFTPHKQYNMKDRYNNNNNNIINNKRNFYNNNNNNNIRNKNMNMNTYQNNNKYNKYNNNDDDKDKRVFTKRPYLNQYNYRNNNNMNNRPYYHNNNNYQNKYNYNKKYKYYNNNYYKSRSRSRSNEIKDDRMKEFMNLKKQNDSDSPQHDNSYTADNHPIELKSNIRKPI